MKQKAFFKVSGDLFISSGFLRILKKLSEDYDLTICVGGGRQINQIFQSKGLTLTKHGPLGRELKLLKDKILAKNILNKNKFILQKKLKEMKIHGEVIIPVIMIGSVLCHVNGDQFVRTAYIGFDKLFVITTPDRKKKKENEFKTLASKVKILTVQSPNQLDSFKG